MSASAAASAGFAASSAASASAARRERQKAECIVNTMPDFRHSTATVEQRQAYANCVDLVHPQAMTGSELAAAKFFVFIALVGAGIGAWRGFGGNPDIPERVMAMFMGALILPLCVGGILALGYGAWWLVS